MKPKRPSYRQRRPDFQPEMLETRQLLTGGAGNTFAILTGTIATANQKLSVPFEYQPSLITLNSKHQMTLGIDVAAQAGATIVPKIVGVEDLTTHKMLPVSRSSYVKTVQLANPQLGNQATAVLVTLRYTAAQAQQPHQYAVVVQARGGTTGQLLVGFYLPGDVQGTGTVDNSDTAAIKQDKNINASNPNYVFAADSNRDGVINNTDLRAAEQNMGVSTTITPVVAANLDPTSDSGIQDRVTNIQDVTFNGTATPGATLTFTDTDNTAPVATATANAQGNYSIQVLLGPGANTFQVTSTDPFEQTITGTIAPVTYSLTAPAAVSTIPSTTPSPNVASGSTSNSTTSGPSTTS